MISKGEKNMKKIVVWLLSLLLAAPAWSALAQEEKAEKKKPTRAEIRAERRAEREERRAERREKKEAAREAKRNRNKSSGAEPAEKN
jgi:Ni/Co efflux regulator RcnB